MSESIYIIDTGEFLLETGCIIKEKDLTKEELEELRSNCDQVKKLFGNIESDNKILKG